MPARKPEEKMSLEVRRYVKLLKHYNKPERVEAARALADLAHASAVPHLIKALHDDYYAVRTRSAFALGKIKDPSALPHLAQALQDEDTNVREHAAWALGEIGRVVRKEGAKTKEGNALLLVLPYCRKVLGNGEYDEPRVIAKAYQAALEGKVTPENAGLYVRRLRIVDKALRHADPDTRKKVAGTMRRFGHERLVPFFIEALQHEDPYVRGNAAWALGQIGRGLQGKSVEGKEVKALQFVSQYFQADEEPRVIRKAYQAALEGKVSAANTRLYIKQLRAMQGSLK